MILEEVHKLNKENQEKSSQHKDLQVEVSPKETQFAVASPSTVVRPRQEDSKEIVEPEIISEEVAEDKEPEGEADTVESVSTNPDKEEEVLKDGKEGQQEITDTKKEENTVAAADDAKEAADAKDDIAMR